MAKTEYTELRVVPPAHEELEEIEERIRKAFLEILYRPLMAVLGAHQFSELLTPFLENAKKSALEKALNKSTVVYADGAFSGNFSAAISKELKGYGAKWDKKTRAWKLPQRELPDELRPVIASSAARFKARLQAVEKVLSDLKPEKVAGRLRTNDLFASSVLKIDRGIRNTVEKLVVLPELTDAQRETIAREYAGNLDRSIRDFTTEQIANLRKEIQQMVFSGARYDTAVKAIQRSYGVSRNKARFLARQESHLLLTKFKETRYTSAGVDEYRWRTVTGTAAHPVRPSHKKLDGTIQRWDSPPITTAPNEPARRNNPGEDFNCRCQAVPVVRKLK